MSMSWVIYDFSHMFIYLLWFCHGLPKGEIVKTYVIHLLWTYVTILCNWLILWQNALYLYLGRSKVYLILQEILFQNQVLKPCKSQAEKCKFIKAWQLVSIELEELFQPRGSTAAWQMAICRGLWKTEFQICFDFNLWLYVWTLFSHNPRHIKWLF